MVIRPELKTHKNGLYKLCLKHPIKLTFNFIFFCSIKKLKVRQKIANLTISAPTFRSFWIIFIKKIVVETAFLW